MAEYAIVKTLKNKYEIRKTVNNVQNPARPTIQWLNGSLSWTDDSDRQYYDFVKGRDSEVKAYGVKKYRFKFSAKKDFDRIVEKANGRNPEVEVIETVVVADPPPPAINPARGLVFAEAQPVDQW